MKKAIIFIMIFSCVFVKAQEGKEINIATYNIRYNNLTDGENIWGNRKEVVRDLIRYHEFDIFGIQEGMVDQVEYLSSEMLEYAFIGKGRIDGEKKGEYSAIFYNKSRFKLLNNGDFWLSETCDKPSFGWDAACIRICSWGKFEDKMTKKVFFFFNVHFDHVGEEARKKSGNLMVKKIQEISKGISSFCVGDFNSTPDTQQIKTIKMVLSDSKDVSLITYGPEGTFNGFDYNAPMEKRIDYVFTSEKIKVLKYGVLTDSYKQHFPSDHQPVVVKVIIE